MSNIPPKTSSRLERLNSLLNTVDASLASGNQDTLVDNIIDNGGRIRLDVVSQKDSGNNSSSQKNGQAEDKGICERKPVIFKKCHVPPPTIDASEEDFEMTPQDAKRLQHDLTEAANRDANRAFVFKSYVHGKNKQLKMNAYSHCVVRFELNSDYVLQLCFLSNEKSKVVYDEFHSLLKNPQSKFDLSLVITSVIERSTIKDLIDVDIAPASTLRFKNKNFTFNSDDIMSHFKSDLVSLVSDEEATNICNNWLKCNSIFTPFAPTINPRPSAGMSVGSKEQVSSNNSRGNTQSSNNQSVTGRFLKFLGKKK
uniref:Ras-associating domain-containing protein n=1 Tax=Strongyloides venezuelensis TaxID=75913 RepID=A0A0K0FN56_STRVS